MPSREQSVSPRGSFSQRNAHRSSPTHSSPSLSSPSSRTTVAATTTSAARHGVRTVTSDTPAAVIGNSQYHLNAFYSGRREVLSPNPHQTIRRSVHAEESSSHEVDDRGDRTRAAGSPPSLLHSRRSSRHLLQRPSMTSTGQLTRQALAASSGAAPSPPSLEGGGHTTNDSSANASPRSVVSRTLPPMNNESGEERSSRSGGGSANNNNNTAAVRAAPPSPRPYENAAPPPRTAAVPSPLTPHDVTRQVSSPLSQTATAHRPDRVHSNADAAATASLPPLLTTTEMRSMSGLATSPQPDSPSSPQPTPSLSRQTPASGVPLEETTSPEPPVRRGPASAPVSTKRSAGWPLLLGQFTPRRASSPRTQPRVEVAATANAPVASASQPMPHMNSATDDTSLDSGGAATMPSQSTSHPAPHLSQGQSFMSSFRSGRGRGGPVGVAGATIMAPSSSLRSTSTSTRLGSATRVRRNMGGASNGGGGGGGAGGPSASAPLVFRHRRRPGYLLCPHMAGATATATTTSTSPHPTEEEEAASSSASPPPQTAHSHTPGGESDSGVSDGNHQQQQQHRQRSRPAPSTMLQYMGSGLHLRRTSPLGVKYPAVVQQQQQQYPSPRLPAASASVVAAAAAAAAHRPPRSRVSTVSASSQGATAAPLPSSSSTTTTTAAATTAAAVAGAHILSERTTPLSTDPAQLSGGGSNAPSCNDTGSLLELRLRPSEVLLRQREAIAATATAASEAAKVAADTASSGEGSRAVVSPAEPATFSHSGSPSSSPPPASTGASNSNTITDAAAASATTARGKKQTGTNTLREEVKHTARPTPPHNGAESVTTTGTAAPEATSSSTEAKSLRANGNRTSSPQPPKDQHHQHLAAHPSRPSHTSTTPAGKPSTSTLPPPPPPPPPPSFASRTKGAAGGASVLSGSLPGTSTLSTDTTATTTTTATMTTTITLSLAAPVASASQPHSANNRGGSEGGAIQAGQPRPLRASVGTPSGAPSASFTSQSASTVVVMAAPTSAAAAATTARSRAVQGPSTTLESQQSASLPLRVAKPSHAPRPTANRSKAEDGNAVSPAAAKRAVNDNDEVRDTEKPPLQQRAQSPAPPKASTPIDRSATGKTSEPAGAGDVAVRDSRDTKTTSPPPAAPHASSPKEPVVSTVAAARGSPHPSPQQKEQQQQHEKAATPRPRTPTTAPSSVPARRSHSPSTQTTTTTTTTTAAVTAVGDLTATDSTDATVPDAPLSLSLRAPPPLGLPKLTHRTPTSPLGGGKARSPSQQSQQNPLSNSGGSKQHSTSTRGATSGSNGLTNTLISQDSSSSPSQPRHGAATTRAAVATALPTAPQIRGESSDQFSWSARRTHGDGDEDDEETEPGAALEDDDGGATTAMELRQRQGVTGAYAAALRSIGVGRQHGESVPHSTTHERVEETDGVAVSCSMRSGGGQASVDQATSPLNVFTAGGCGGGGGGERSALRASPTPRDALAAGSPIPFSASSRMRGLASQRQWSSTLRRDFAPTSAKTMGVYRFTGEEDENDDDSPFVKQPPAAAAAAAAAATNALSQRKEKEPVEGTAQTAADPSSSKLAAAQLASSSSTSTPLPQRTPLNAVTAAAAALSSTSSVVPGMLTPDEIAAILNNSPLLSRAATAAGVGLVRNSSVLSVHLTPQQRWKLLQKQLLRGAAEGVAGSDAAHSHHKATTHGGAAAAAAAADGVEEAQASSHKASAPVTGAEHDRNVVRNDVKKLEAEKPIATAVPPSRPSAEPSPSPSNPKEPNAAGDHARRLPPATVQENTATTLATITTTTTTTTTASAEDLRSSESKDPLSTTAQYALQPLLAMRNASMKIVNDSFIASATMRRRRANSRFSSVVRGDRVTAVPREGAEGDSAANAERTARTGESASRRYERSGSRYDEITHSSSSSSRSNSFVQREPSGLPQGAEKAKTTSAQPHETTVQQQQRRHSTLPTAPPLSAHEASDRARATPSSLAVTATAATVAAAAHPLGNALMSPVVNLTPPTTTTTATPPSHGIPTMNSQRASPVFPLHSDSAVAPATMPASSPVTATAAVTPARPYDSRQALLTNRVAQAILQGEFGCYSVGVSVDEAGFSSHQPQQHRRSSSHVHSSSSAFGEMLSQGTPSATPSLSTATATHERSSGRLTQSEQQQQQQPSPAALPARPGCVPQATTTTTYNNNNNNSNLRSLHALLEGNGSPYDGKRENDDVPAVPGGGAYKDQRTGVEGHDTTDDEEADSVYSTDVYAYDVGEFNALTQTKEETAKAAAAVAAALRGRGTDHIVRGATAIGVPAALTSSANTNAGDARQPSSTTRSAATFSPPPASQTAGPAVPYTVDTLPPFSPAVAVDVAASDNTNGTADAEPPLLNTPNVVQPALPRSIPPLPPPLPPTPLTSVAAPVRPHYQAYSHSASFAPLGLVAQPHSSVGSNTILSGALDRVTASTTGEECDLRVMPSPLTAFQPVLRGSDSLSVPRNLQPEHHPHPHAQQPQQPAQPQLPSGGSGSVEKSTSGSSPKRPPGGVPQPPPPPPVASSLSLKTSSPNQARDLGDRVRQQRPALAKTKSLTRLQREKPGEAAAAVPLSSPPSATAVPSEGNGQACGVVSASPVAHRTNTEVPVAVAAHTITTTTEQRSPRPSSFAKVAIVAETAPSALPGSFTYPQKENNVVTDARAGKHAADRPSSGRLTHTSPNGTAQTNHPIYHSHTNSRVSYRSSTASSSRLSGGSKTAMASPHVVRVELPGMDWAWAGRVILGSLSSAYTTTDDEECVSSSAE